jgi:hypothetical protein
LIGNLRHSLEILLGRVGLLILAANVLIASIPRCDLLFSMLNSVAGERTALRDEPMSCHGQPSSNAETGVRVSDNSPCRCLLLRFLSFPVQSLNYQEHIVYRPQFLYEFNFELLSVWSDFLPAIEPPYPKTFV